MLHATNWSNDPLEKHVMYYCMQMDGVFCERDFWTNGKQQACETNKRQRQERALR
jgi:hypothetical protein